MQSINAHGIVRSRPRIAEWVNLVVGARNGFTLSLARDQPESVVIHGGVVASPCHDESVMAANDIR